MNKILVESITLNDSKAETRVKELIAEYKNICENYRDELWDKLREIEMEIQIILVEDDPERYLNATFHFNSHGELFIEA